MVAVATGILVTGPMQFMPKTGLRELDHTLPQEFVANIFGLLAVLYLGWAGMRAIKASRFEGPVAARMARDGARP